MLSIKLYFLIMESISILYLVLARVLKQSAGPALFAYFLGMQIGILLGCCLLWGIKRIQKFRKTHRKEQKITQTFQTSASQAKAIQTLFEHGYDLQTLIDACIPEQ